MREEVQRSGPSVLRLALTALVLAGMMGGVPALAGESTVRTVVPVGRAVGVKLFSDGVMVVGFSQVPAARGESIPAKECGLREGDVITHINAAEVDTIEDVQAQLAQIGGEAMSIRALREGEQIQLTAQAVKCSTDGSYKLGAWLRDSMAGIGTVTYYDPATGAFGALGHGINDVDTAQLMPLESGGVLRATVSDVKKGKRGEPGELHGELELEKDIGELERNTCYGIFGTLTDGALTDARPVEVAAREEIHTGNAFIYANVVGDEVRRYEVEITKLFPKAEDGRDMMVKVTDPDLIAATGGIVQGMSGSPILQDGRIVGAVTHVLIGDSTQGYGISMENMLRAGETDI